MGGAKSTNGLGVFAPHEVWRFRRNENFGNSQRKEVRRFMEREPFGSSGTQGGQAGRRQSKANRTEETNVNQGTTKIYINKIFRLPIAPPRGLIC